MKIFSITITVVLCLVTIVTIAIGGYTVGYSDGLHDKGTWVPQAKTDTVWIFKPK